MHFNLGQLNQVGHFALVAALTYLAAHAAPAAKKVGSAATALRHHLDAQTAAIKDPKTRGVVELAEGLASTALESQVGKLVVAGDRIVPGSGQIVSAAVAGVTGSETR